MTAMPDFRRDLLAAGDRFYARGARLRRGARQAVPALLAAAALAAAVLVAGGGTADRRDEQAAAPVAPGAEFAALRRQPTPVDALPKGPEARRFDGYDTRRIAEADGWTVWLAAGRDDVCIVFAGTPGSGSSCAGRRHAATGQLFAHVGHRILGVAPDWATELRIEGPHPVAVPILSNGYVAEVPARSQRIMLAGAGRTEPLPDAVLLTKDRPAEPGRDPLFGVLPSPRRRPQLVVAWASWCPPCRATLRTVAVAAPRIEALGVDISAVAYRDEPDQARRVARELGVPFAVHMDVAGASAVDAVPAVRLFGADGRLLGDFDGGLEAPELEAMVSRSLPSG